MKEINELKEKVSRIIESTLSNEDGTHDNSGDIIEVVNEVIEEAYMLGLKEGMRTVWEEGLKGVTE